MLTITTNSFENDVLHADKPVLVDFWAQWCPYCRRIAPAFDKVGEQYADTLTADPATLSLRQVAEAVNTRFVDCAWHSGDIDRDCAICSGMAGVMDALYRSMNEECAAYLSNITITDIETQLFTQK